MVNHGSILLKDTVWLLFLQNQPFNSPTKDLRVDGDEVGSQREDLDHIGCQPGSGRDRETPGVRQSALGDREWHPHPPVNREGQWRKKLVLKGV